MKKLVNRITTPDGEIIVFEETQEEASRRMLEALLLGAMSSMAIEGEEIEVVLASAPLLPMRVLRTE